ncbi:MAG: helix-turn-helix transcriptional regulator [Dehalococcoidia bacterium]
MTTATASPASVGDLLRDWRQRRHLSQLDLALDAEVSTRHLSFVETGRARPSRDLVLHLAEQLDVPLRERNTLLLSAGYAPIFRETPLEQPEMASVREALDRILAGHEPYPAIAVDGHWNLVSNNRPATSLLAAGVSPALLAPPANALRIALHPDGLGPRILNFGEWSEHLISRLHRQAVASGDAELARLEEELRGYPGVRSEASAHVEATPHLYVPLVLQGPDGGELRFFSTISTFGTALDITMAELAIECFFPADEHTAATFRALAPSA